MATKKAPLYKRLTTPEGKRSFQREHARRLKSDPEYAAHHAATMKWFAALDAHEAARRKGLQHLRDTGQGMSIEQQAERWLRFVLEDPTETLDREALVWLASRELATENEIEQTRADWKRSEERFITRAIGEGIPISAARKVEGVPQFQLPDFWKPAPGPHPAEATMLRVIEWCGITGFDAWFNRYAKETHEDIVLGGPDPEQTIWWLFDHCRSVRAMQILRPSLNRCLDVIRIVPSLVDVPWMRFEGKVDENGPIHVEHIAYAASLVFCEARLQNRREDGLVERALILLEKKQRSDGAWGYTSHSTKPSIEVTSMIVHAFAFAGHPEFKRVTDKAAEWLRSQQVPEGYWQEASSVSAVKLTVMVLDALSLAAGTKTTLEAGSRNSTKVGRLPIRGTRAPRKQNRFRVAFSFPGEIRSRVKGVSEILGRTLGKEHVFYDNNFKAEIAVPDVDEILQDFYLNQSDLVVVWIGKHYTKKMWCHLEWRAIKQIISQRKQNSLMFVKVDDVRPRGIFKTDGYIDLASHTDEQIAGLVLQRLQLLDSKRAKRRAQ